MPTLLLAEHDNNALRDTTAKALTAAKQLGSEVHVLVAGQGCNTVADAAAKLEGVSKVLLADAAPYAHMLAEPVAALIVSLAGPYDAIVAPATTMGKNILPRVAALLDVMQVSDVTKVVANDTFERPIYAGNAIQTVKSSEAKKVITIRTAGFGAAGAGGSAPVEAVAAAADAAKSSFVGEELSKLDRPELTSAKIIISGGRAMQNRENFTKYIEPVADKLGAAVGASRAAVDAGYAPNDWQVGQTGKIVGHFRRHPASRRDEGLQGYRSDQQGRGSADLPGCRLWSGSRPVPGTAGACGRAWQNRSLTISGNAPFLCCRSGKVQRKQHFW
jgi:electron transfer flavoprotein alpha subunit